MTTLKDCSVCGTSFSCGTDAEHTGCWCSGYPPIMPADFTQQCRCPACLKEVIQEKIAEFIKTITPENASDSIAKKYATDEPPIEGFDYYLNEDGNCVFTQWYLLKRGHCCENGCAHCPYGFARR